MKQTLQGETILLSLVFILTSSIWFIASESKKEGAEFVGFPESFADLAEKVKPA